MDRVKLCIYTKTDSTFSFICDKGTAQRVILEYGENIPSKIKVSGTLDCVDAHQTEAVFEAEAIEAMQIIEIKQL